MDFLPVYFFFVLCIENPRVGPCEKWYNLVGPTLYAILERFSFFVGYIMVYVTIQLTILYVYMLPLQTLDYKWILNTSTQFPQTFISPPTQTDLRIFRSKVFKHVNKP